ncbi:hypothetical protein CF326_g1279 [Tilletia indica]|nr:hypothetical protein CF326_g1279 [Tilletia indica]
MTASLRNERQTTPPKKEEDASSNNLRSSKSQINTSIAISADSNLPHPSRRQRALRLLKLRSRSAMFSLGRSNLVQRCPSQFLLTRIDPPVICNAVAPRLTISTSSAVSLSASIPRSMPRAKSDFDVLIIALRAELQARQGTKTGIDEAIASARESTSTLAELLSALGISDTQLDRRLSEYQSATHAADLAAKLRKWQKEAEMDDFVNGMEAYDWQKPSFPTSDSGPRLVYINSATDPSLDSTLTDLVERPIDADEDDPVTLGFDTEWKVDWDGVGRTALMQICSRSLVLILHITHMVPMSTDALPTFPPALETLLRRSDVLKTGVRIEGDAKKLRAEFRQRAQDNDSSKDAEGIATDGLLELSRLAQRIDPERWSSHGRRLISLRELCAVYLGRKLIKDSTRTSDWSQKSLTDEQMKYAASDVMAGLDIYEAIRRRAKERAQGSTESLKPLPRPNGESTATDEGQKDDDASLGSQMSTLKVSTVAQPLPFDEALRAATSNLSRPAASTAKSTARKPPAKAASAEKPTARKSPAKSKSPTEKVPSTELDSLVNSMLPGESSAPAKDAVDRPKPLLAYQRTFDLWEQGVPGDDRFSFYAIAGLKRIQPNTVAEYVLKAFVEGRYASDEVGRPARSAPIPAGLKKRLAAAISGLEFGATTSRYKWWLDKHKIHIGTPQ